jgi:serine/threonine protein kinase
MGTKRNRWASSSEDEDDNDAGRRSKVASKRKDTKKEQSKGEDDKEESNQSERKVSSAAEPLAQRPAATASATALPLHNPLLQGSRKVYECYERLAMVSEGTYGVVWKARDVATNDVVALKQIKFSLTDPDASTTSYTTSSIEQLPQQHQREGFPVTALREINVLLALSHESIVTVKEMVVGDAIDKVFMVMEYYEFDLKVGISNFDGPLFQGELKGIMQQVLSATQYMHSKWYLHRDLKPSNILVHRSGRIALADFGLARCVVGGVECVLFRTYLRVYRNARNAAYAQFSHIARRCLLGPNQAVPRPSPAADAACCDLVVPRAGAAVWRDQVFDARRHVERRVHFRGAHCEGRHPARPGRARPDRQDLWACRGPERGHVAWL